MAGTGRCGRAVLAELRRAGATLVEAHSEKAEAILHYKGGIRVSSAVGICGQQRRSPGGDAAAGHAAAHDAADHGRVCR